MVFVDAVDVEVEAVPALPGVGGIEAAAGLARIEGEDGF
jgi:hypothetical protein